MVYDQNNFSKSYNQMYLEETRVLKANKALAVIHDFLGPTSEMYLLDIGCSTGIMTNHYAKKFKNTVGIDIDTTGIKFAKESFENKNLNFYNCSHEDSMLGNEKFDVVICTHIYEHVDNPKTLMDSIHRVLKPGGVCYFVAGNRHKIIEPHFKLPFLSFLPKRIGRLYIKLLKKEGEYYQKHLSFFKLKKLVNKFTLFDYTTETIRNPKKYYSTDLVEEGSILQRIYVGLTKVLYFLIPTYIWILKKEISNKDFQ